MNKEAVKLTARWVVRALGIWAAYSAGLLVVVVGLEWLTGWSKHTATWVVVGTWISAVALFTLYGSAKARLDAERQG